MLQSQLFTKIKRESPKGEEAINAKLLIRAGFIDKVMAGVYSFLPLGFRVLTKIEGIIREEMERMGGEEVFLPTLHPKSNWEKTGRWKTYDSLFRFKSYYSKIDYVLGSTHEEIISPLMKKFISSYKDLPRYVFQIQNKFRDEARVKSGLLRGREFIMKDLYSFHTDEADLDNYYEKMRKSYSLIFNRIGIGHLTYLTFASGGTFSKYSHEFQTITEAGEDKIYICDKCKVAVNNEITKEQSNCPECGNKKLRLEKAIEVGNIFKLKTKFSDPFKLAYRTARGREEIVYMGCYGIGLNRLMGTIVEVSRDGKGIIWPESVSPFVVHLVELQRNREDHSGARKIYGSLQKAGVQVLYDDRKNVSPGEKLVEADLIGISLRAVISEKTGDKIELKKRSEDRTKMVTEKELINFLSKK